MRNIFRLRRGRKNDRQAPPQQHVPPPPLAQALIQGYLKGVRDQLVATGQDPDIPLSSQAREQLQDDCVRFYLQTAGFLVRSADQAYRAGYDFYQARNGAEHCFPEEFWPGSAAVTLSKVAAKFNESYPIEGDDGLIYLSQEAA